MQLLHHYKPKLLGKRSGAYFMLEKSLKACNFFQMTRYFLNQESPKDKQKPQSKYSERATQKLEIFKRHRHNFCIEKSQKEIEALVTVVKYKRKPWRGRKHEDDRFFSAKIQQPLNRKVKRVPVPEEKLARHSRGEGLSGDGIKTNFHQKKLKKHEADIEFSIEQAARAELLLPEESG